MSPGKGANIRVRKFDLVEPGDMENSFLNLGITMYLKELGENDILPHTFLS